jgi:hypothetical protein
MNVRYQIELSQVERGELTALLSGGKHAARKLKRAQILLAADAGAGDENIATALPSSDNPPPAGFVDASLVPSGAELCCTARVCIRQGE